MSYCRFSAASDVYMFPSLPRGGGKQCEIVCCRCKLDSRHHDQRFVTAKAAMIHVGDHIEAGHKVPTHVMERLLKEAADLVGEMG